MAFYSEGQPTILLGCQFHVLEVFIMLFRGPSAYSSDNIQSLPNELLIEILRSCEPDFKTMFKLKSTSRRGNFITEAVADQLLRKYFPYRSKEAGESSVKLFTDLYTQLINNIEEARKNMKVLH